MESFKKNIAAWALSLLTGIIVGAGGSWYATDKAITKFALRFEYVERDIARLQRAVERVDDRVNHYHGGG